jgi:cytoskeletal protein CcmA (bactofilin family)
MLVAAAKQTVRPKSVPAIISIGVTVTGTLSSTGEIQPDGRIDGDVHCTRLVVSESGRIYGAIVEKEVLIRGRVKGLICAHDVLLCAGAHVEGGISYGTLRVEAGAIIKGGCRRSAHLNIEAPKADAENMLQIIPAAVAWAT